MGSAASTQATRIPSWPTWAAGPRTEKIEAPMAVPAPSMTRSIRRTPWRSWSVIRAPSPRAAGRVRHGRNTHPGVPLHRLVRDGIGLRRPPETGAEGVALGDEHLATQDHALPFRHRLRPELPGEHHLPDRVVEADALLATHEHRLQHVVQLALAARLRADPRVQAGEIEAGASVGDVAEALVAEPGVGDPVRRPVAGRAPPVAGGHLVDLFSVGLDGGEPAAHGQQRGVEGGQPLGEPARYALRRLDAPGPLVGHLMHQGPARSFRLRIQGPGAA